MTFSLFMAGIVAAVVLGHFGMFVAFYNRANSFGWPRRWTKRLSKLLLGTMVTLPLCAVVTAWDGLAGLLGGESFASLPTWLQLYGGACLLVWIFLGIPWLVWRPVFAIEWAPARREIRVIDVGQSTGVDLAGSERCRRLAGVPLNQIFELAVERVELPVVGLPAELDGYRIAHLSDVHLTGDFKPDYLRYVIDQARAWSPEAFVLTGDIIDKQHCISWIGDLFGRAHAVDGCYFILGNHDTRVVDSRMTRVAMNQAGWVDVGGLSMRHRFRGVEVEVVGTEVPWYDGPRISRVGSLPFRLLLSHSPDQFFWARQHHFHLMLAGHTHGGQGRLPLAGPILSPSWHGSRWASGDFYRSPTTMHVSRGLGGVHLLRINCRPELSLLELKCR